MLKRVLLGAAALSFISSQVLADCTNFIEPGRNYTIDYRQVSPPGDSRSFQVVTSNTRTEGNCRVQQGAFASWTYEFRACNTFSLRGTSSGGYIRPMTGEGTCSGNVATGTMSYVDSNNSTFHYQWTLTK